MTLERAMELVDKFEENVRISAAEFSNPTISFVMRSFEYDILSDLINVSISLYSNIEKKVIGIANFQYPKFLQNAGYGWFNSKQQAKDCVYDAIKKPTLDIPGEDDYDVEND